MVLRLRLVRLQEAQECFRTRARRVVRAPGGGGDRRGVLRRLRGVVRGQLRRKVGRDRGRLRRGGGRERLDGTDVRVLGLAGAAGWCERMGVLEERCGMGRRERTYGRCGLVRLKLIHVQILDEVWAETEATEPWLVVGKNMFT